MTLERAQQLTIEHGCRFKTHYTSLVVINETINFKYTVFFHDLPQVSEETFISTITTGRPPQGQRELFGVYQDARRAEEIGFLAFASWQGKHN